MDDVPSRPSAPLRTARHVEPVMGTVVSFELRGHGDHDAAIRDAVDWFHAADERFSPYRATSEVSRYARGELAAGSLSPDLAEVVAACEAMEAVTGGAFSARLPGGYDPSGWVKGWSVERAARILRSHGCGDFSINAGGDVLVAATGRDRAPWRIGVRHPFDPAAVAAVVEAHDLAVATSGRYERGDHVVDPRTGLPALGTAAVTVCGPDLALADAFATAALVLGDAGPAWVAGLDGYESWTVFDDGRVVATAGFPRVVEGVPVRLVPAGPTSGRP